MPQERRFFVTLPNSDRLSTDQSLIGLEISLEHSDSHHVRDVLRLEVGASLSLVCRLTGREFDGFISALGNPVMVKIAGIVDRQLPESRVISISLALLKGGNNELVIEKCSELGVQNIILWQAERSIVKLQQDGDAKIARWNKIAEAASKQSGRNIIPRVLFAPNIAKLLDLIFSLSTLEDTLLCCSLGKEAVELKSLVPQPKRVHFIVGPEGDFTQSEEEQIYSRGFKKTTLGPLRLRAETAAIVAAASANALWGCE